MWKWLTDKNNKAAIIVGLVASIIFLSPKIWDSGVFVYSLVTNPDKTKEQEEKIVSLEQLSNSVHEDLELARDSVKSQFKDVYIQLDSLNSLHSKYIKVQEDADAVRRYCQTLSFLHQSYMNKTSYRGITYYDYNGKRYYYDVKSQLLFIAIYSQQEDTYYYHTLDKVSHWAK